MASRVGEVLKSVGKWLWNAYILTPLLAALPPAALWTFARDFVISSHTVPGWVMLVASAFPGLLLVSLGFNLAPLRDNRCPVSPPIASRPIAVQKRRDSRAGRSAALELREQLHGQRVAAER